MAQPNRETVYAALLTLLTNALGPTGSGDFVTLSRRIQPGNSFAPAEAPALFQVEHSETISSTKGLPSVRVFMVHLVCYANYGSEVSVVPSTALNNLVTAIEGAVGPNLATGFQQLGIPISSTQIKGSIEYWEQAGTSGEWSAVLVPVELTATY